MNLSKALGTIDHRLMIPKLGEYGCSKDLLKLILSYLKNRKKITVNENPMSKSCNIANYTDDNILYATGGCFEVTIEKLSADLISFRSWIYEN